jgi:hypothetical protein
MRTTASLWTVLAFTHGRVRTLTLATQERIAIGLQSVRATRRFCTPSGRFDAGGFRLRCRTTASKLRVWRNR